MIIETVQWNIGGGLIRGEDDNPRDPNSYTKDGLDLIISELAARQPHIITLQEVQSRGRSFNQADIIADALKQQLRQRYHVQHFPLSPSHFQDGNELGIAILSRFPLWIPEREKFKTPDWKLEKPDGQLWVPHDKGMLRVKIPISERTRLMVATAHVVPAHVFGKELGGPENLELINDMRRKLELKPELHPLYLIQGDFNVDAMRVKTSDGFAKRMIPFDLSEVSIPQPTLFDGKTVDHVFYRGIRPSGTNGLEPLYYRPEIVQTLTDHTLIACRFEVPVEPDLASPTPTATRSVSYPIMLHRR